MNLLRITLFLILSLGLRCMGQNEQATAILKDRLVNPYQKYFITPRQQIYVHFNKSTYVPGDDVWFKCYVFDPETKLPSNLAQNLITELYDARGKLVSQKILLTNNGTADNGFKIDIAGISGIYTFKAYTRWMKNFSDIDPFITTLVVLGNVMRDTLRGENKYDVQFFPESGILLKGESSRVAIKALDVNGKGVKLKGFIVDEQADTVGQVELNDLGMGEVLIDARQKSTYICRIPSPDGKFFEYPLPPVSEKGIIVQVNPFSKDKVMIRLVSNEKTITSGRLFYAVVHDNGIIAKTAYFSLDPANLSQTLEINKADLFNGVNCLTVFDDHFQPVAERLFYIKKANIRGAISLEKRLEGDSLAMEIFVADSAGKPATASLSMSVLPRGTESNQFTSSLLTEIMIKAGVKGQIENPAYYLENDDFTRQEALDALLLTQGWRKYNWTDILDSTPKPLVHNFEQSFTIQGEIKNWLSGKREKRSLVALFSPKNNLFNLAQTDSTGKFSFSNLNLPDSANLLITAMNKNGNGWNRTVSAVLDPEYKPDSIIPLPKNYTFNPVVTGYQPIKLYSWVIQLKEVQVIKKKEPKPFADWFFGSSIDPVFRITEANYARYNSLSDVLLDEFSVNKFYDSEGNISLDMGGFRSSTHPTLYIDGMRMFDLVWLDALPVTDVEFISVIKNRNNSGGAVLIVTRKIPVYWSWIQPSNLKTIKVKGYAKPVAYHTPRYAIPTSSPDYRKYAAIYWKPDIKTDSTGKTKMKFIVPQQPGGIDIRIEGMADNGTVYLEEKKMDL